MHPHAQENGDTNISMAGKLLWHGTFDPGTFDGSNSNMNSVKWRNETNSMNEVLGGCEW